MKHQSIKILFGVLLTILSFGFTSGQVKTTDPIKALAEKVNPSNGILIEFTLNYPDQKPISGCTLLAQGEKFHLTTMPLTAWYNGELLWVMQSGTNEVNLTSPSESELEELALLISLNRMLKQHFTTSVQQLSNNMFRFVATPRVGYEGMITSLSIDTDSSYSPTIVRFKEKGDRKQDKETVIEIKKITKPYETKGKNFEFDKKNFPRGIEVIDLR
ncbi:MAG: LolA-like putative outer membrane lipoprotein chaperone [Porphyromonas sp.]|nr:LolA-like putative outer membrane lipoprotein chaperone [Porphyromonas sp.]